MVKRWLLLTLSLVALTNGAPVFARPLVAAANGRHVPLIPVASTPANRAELSRLVGVHVDGPQGDRIGVVESVHIKKDGIVEVIIGVGGYLDVGDRDVALNLDKLQITGTDRKAIKVNISKSELMAMPKFVFSNAKERGTVYGSPE